VSDTLDLNPALYQPVTRDDALPSSSASVGQAADLSGHAPRESGSAERRQSQPPSMTFEPTALRTKERLRPSAAAHSEAGRPWVPEFRVGRRHRGRSREGKFIRRIGRLLRRG
jgi:hypothetical protein